MSSLQEQIVQKISGLSEDNLQFLLEMIERFMQPEVREKNNMVINNNQQLTIFLNIYFLMYL